ncbi:hypothetical protein [Serratia marcescens]|uniref:hypothetical protein n=1 Tax=Serratia marcescens TaxID=615 RepID=UPI003D013DF8
MANPKTCLTTTIEAIIVNGRVSSIDVKTEGILANGEPFSASGYHHPRPAGSSGTINIVISPEYDEALECHRAIFDKFVTGNFAHADNGAESVTARETEQVIINPQASESTAKDISLDNHDAMTSLLAVCNQIRAELKYHYANDHIIGLVDIFQGVFVNTDYYKKGQGNLPDGDSMRKYIRRAISGWLSSR